MCAQAEGRECRVTSWVLHGYDDIDDEEDADDVCMYIGEAIS